MSVTHGFKVYTKWLDIIYPLQMPESQAHISRIERPSSVLTHVKLSLVWTFFLRNIAY